MADIALILKDMFSSKANSVVNANKGLSKSLEEAQRKATDYSKRLSALTSSLAQQRTQMVTVKKELQDAEKAFRECADAANEDALTKAYEKYENLKNSIADTAKSAKEAQGQLRKLNDETNRINSNSTGGASNNFNNNTEKSTLQALMTAGLGKRGAVFPLPK